MKIRRIFWATFFLLFSVSSFIQPLFAEDVITFDPITVTAPPASSAWAGRNYWLPDSYVSGGADFTITGFAQPPSNCEVNIMNDGGFNFSKNTYSGIFFENLNVPIQVGMPVHSFSVNAAAHGTMFGGATITVSGTFHGTTATNPIIIYTLTATPDPIIINQGSITFTATANQPCSIQFSVKTPDGSDISLGSVQTTGPDNSASILWPSPNKLGVYTVTAQAGQSSRECAFTVIDVPTNEQFLGMLTSLATKDIQDLLKLVNPSPYVCPDVQFTCIINYFNGVLNGLMVGDPVNIYTGNYCMVEQDLTLKSRIPLTVARIYNSQDNRVTPFGRGWSSPFFVSLEIASDQIKLIDADGGRVFFTRSGNLWKAPPGVDVGLRSASDTGFWTVYQPQGAEWNFDESGKIFRMVKACCGTGALDEIAFEYGSDGKLKRVLNPTGQWFELTYNQANRVIKITDSTSRTLDFGYNGAGDLVSFTNPIAEITQYAYTGNYLSKITRPGKRITEIAYSGSRVSSVTDPNGSRATFAWNGDKMVHVDHAGTEHIYTFNANGIVTNYKTMGNISKDLVSSGSAIIEFSDAYNNKYTFTYFSNGLMESSKDSRGYMLFYTWDPKTHKLLKKKDVIGREWCYIWDSRGNLIAEVDPAGNITSHTHDIYNNRTSTTNPKRRKTIYRYDPQGVNLTGVVDPSGATTVFTHDNRRNILTITDSLHRTTRFSHDNLDRPIKTQYHDGRFQIVTYDAAGDVVSRKDNSNRETLYGFDFNGRPVSTTRPDGSVVLTSYNAAGRPVSETDANGSVTRFEYDGLGRLVKTIYSDGSFVTMEYDLQGRMIARVDELGNKSQSVFDAMGNLIATIDAERARWESTFDIAGRKTIDKDPLGRLTTYVSDVLDRVTKVTRPDKSIIQSAFDSTGDLLYSIDTLGYKTSWEYDSLGRPIKTIRSDGSFTTTTFDSEGQVLSETDAAGNRTTHTYDLGGRVLTTTYPNSGVLRNIYDSAGRLVGTVDPIGAVSSTTFDIMDRVIAQSDPLGNVTRTEYDKVGNPVVVINANGGRSITVYNSRGWVVAEIDPEGRKVTYGHDLRGQRISLIDGANRTWRWVRNKVGLVIEEIDPSGNKNKFQYNSVGVLTHWTNARNQVTKYFLDTMDRPIRIEYPDNSIATFSYDLEGRELCRSGKAGAVVKTWDSVGNLTSETFLPWNKKWKYAFDTNGNRIRAQDPEGQVIVCEFNSLNQITKLARAKNWTSKNYFDEVLSSYDKAGRLVQIKKFGVKTSCFWDKAGRLLEIKHEKNAKKPKLLASRKYGYDQVGNRVFMVDESGAKTRYFFDRSDWLNKVQYPEGDTVSYFHNGAGDRLKEIIETPIRGRTATDTQTIDFIYDLGGRMTNRGADTFFFDADGNLVKSIENGEETRNFWSSDNRLIKVEKDIQCSKHGRSKCKCRFERTLKEEYSSLPEDWRRVQVKNSTGNYISTYDGDDESNEYFETPAALRKPIKIGRFTIPSPFPWLIQKRSFYSGPGTDDIEATSYHCRDLAMLRDGLGSTIALTNSHGNIITRINYDAWGNFKWPAKPHYRTPPCREDELDDFLDNFEKRNSLGDSFDPWHHSRHYAKVLTPYLYTGRRYQPFSGNYFNRNRYYSPKVGRFTSRDPIGFNGGKNLWGYVKNNPGNFSDPFGFAVDVIAYSDNPKQQEVFEVAKLVKEKYWPTAVFMPSSKYAGPGDFLNNLLLISENNDGIFRFLLVSHAACEAGKIALFDPVKLPFTDSDVMNFGAREKLKSRIPNSCEQLAAKKLFVDYVGTVIIYSCHSEDSGIPRAFLQHTNASFAYGSTEMVFFATQVPFTNWFTKVADPFEQIINNPKAWVLHHGF